MSFLTELPQFTCSFGESGGSVDENLRKLMRSKEYLEKYDEFQPSFMAAKQNVSLKNLQVTFGGFSPTLMSGEGQRVGGYVDKMNERLSEHYAAKRHAARLEEARAGEPRVFDDGSCVWTYVLLDEAEARIERCESAAEDIRIPDEIEGFPVVAIGDDALAGLPVARQIVCPDSVLAIGGCAFRACRKLKRLVLPRFVDSFESSWFRHCMQVEELVLPGALEVIKPDIFDNSDLKRLVIGEGTREIAPGAFAKSKLESATVSPENEVLTSDGRGIYSKDGSWFVALAVPCTAYEVAAGTLGLAKRCMSGFSCVSSVMLPDTLVYIGEFAFYGNQIEEFTAPRALVQIAEKAFFRCSKLAYVELNEGLRAIGDNAFTGTAIAGLALPSTLYQLGLNVAAQSGLIFSGEQATLTLPEDAEYLRLDGYGALYRQLDDGLHLVRLLDPDQTELVLDSGTRFVDEAALLKHDKIERVVMPEGLERIDRRAFKGATALKEARIPSTVRVIGEEAFLDTSLEAVNLPASLEELGANALVSFYAHHGGGQPSVKGIEVAPELADRFFVSGSLLCARKPHGVEVMLCTGMERTVAIPAEACSIAEYAFNGIHTIDELTMSNNISSIGVRGIAIESFVRHVHIDLVEPIEGHDCFDFYFPDTPRSIKQLALAFTTMTECDIEMLFRYYDTVVCNAMGFGKNAGGLKLHEQVARMLERLEDPVFMTTANKETLTRFLHNNVVDVCEALARADDRRSIDRLIDLGYITEENLTECIDRIGTVQDAAMTGYLLEIKRRRFGRVTMDFSL